MLGYAGRRWHGIRETPELLKLTKNPARLLTVRKGGELPEGQRRCCGASVTIKQDN
jgi:hypothetical protein